MGEPTGTSAQQDAGSRDVSLVDDGIIGGTETGRIPLGDEEFREDHIRPDSGYGMKTMKALGIQSRLRKMVYPASSIPRRTMNARGEVHVKCLAEVPVRSHRR
ncbi:MAG: hypothetical protein Q9207_007612 [Kuettlingeria erythrocarpa]